MRDDEPERDPAPDDGRAPATDGAGRPAVATLATECQQLAATRATGALAVTAPTGDGQLRFRDGVVVGAASPAPRARLGDRLVNAGLLDKDELDEALGRQRRSEDHTKLGALLVDEQLVSRDAVRVFVQEQIFDAVFDLSRSEEVALAFRDDLVDPDELRIEVPVEPLLLEVDRREREWEQIERSIASLDMVPGFVPGASSMSASLEPDEFAVLASVDGQRSVRELAEDLGYGDFDAARILHGLMQLGVLRVREPEPGDVDVGAALDDALFGGAAPDEGEALPEPAATPEPSADAAAAAGAAEPAAAEPEPTADDEAPGDTDDETGELERILAQVEAAEAASGGHLRPGATPASAEEEASVDAETQPAHEQDMGDDADLDREDETADTEVAVFEADLPLTAAVEPPSDEPTIDQPPPSDEPPWDEPPPDESSAGEQAPFDRPWIDEPADEDEPPPADEPSAPGSEDAEEASQASAPAAEERGPERSGADVSEFLRELSRLALEDDPQTAAPPPRPEPRRAPDTPPADTGEGGRDERKKDQRKRKRRLFGRGG